MQNSEKQNSIVIFVPITDGRDKFKNIFFIPGKNQFSFCSPNLTSPYVIKRETTAKKKKKSSPATFTYSQVASPCHYGLLLPCWVPRDRGIFTYC